MSRAMNAGQVQEDWESLDQLTQFMNAGQVKEDGESLNQWFEGKIISFQVGLSCGAQTVQTCG
jgi:hypothetical protein